MPDNRSQNKTAILYDFLQVRGGAEAVSIDLCKHFQFMDLIVGWVNQHNFSESPIEPERIIQLTKSTDLQGWQTIKCAQAFINMKLDLSCYESVVYSGSNAPMAILNGGARKKNIYYCHTPPRFVYDLKDFYLNSIPIWQTPLLKGLIHWVKHRYEAAINNMDVVLCNSNNVKARLNRHLGVKAQVVYPPVNIDKFYNKPAEGYYLSTARLEPYKRVDRIVSAFTQMPDKNLIVLSGGSQLAALRELAKNAPNIEFTGWVSEEQMLDYMAKCLATVYIPIDEDFGMSPVESMAAGKPVITCNEGGTAETVLHQETGWHLDADPSDTAIVDLVQSIDVSSVPNFREACYSRAQQFSSEKFFEGINEHLIY